MPDTPTEQGERYRQAFCECGKPTGEPSGNCLNPHSGPGHNKVHDRWMIPLSALDELADLSPRRSVTLTTVKPRTNATKRPANTTELGGKGMSSDPGNRRVKVWNAEDGWRWQRWASSDMTAESGEAYQTKTGAIEAAERESPGLPIEVVVDRSGEGMRARLAAHRAALQTEREKMLRLAEEFDAKADEKRDSASDFSKAGVNGVAAAHLYAEKAWRAAASRIRSIIEEESND